MSKCDWACPDCENTTPDECEKYHLNCDHAAGYCELWDGMGEEDEFYFPLKRYAPQ